MLGIVAVVAAGVFAAALIGLMVGYSWQPSGQETQHQNPAEYKAKENQGEKEKPFWQKATTDPVAAFTLWLVIFTAVLGAAAILQLAALNRAEITSAKAANAAQDAADVAKRALFVSQRPTIAIERFENFSNVDANGAVVSWTFRGYNKNSGNTEAINVHSHVNLAIRPDDIPDAFDYHDVGGGRPATSVISAKQETEMMSYTISIDHALAIYKGTSKMFYYGWFEYDDTFEGTRRHRTEFAYKVTFLTDPRIPEPIKAMRFGPYGERYNCIDKGCLYQPGTPPPQEAAVAGPGVASGIQ